ncbi:MAG TPA: J domain-containing protein [Candidatus Deferrimicrobium sp.]|nr:J domain-containing protein [Candidatus Deferrimicrobium sp.]
MGVRFQDYYEILGVQRTANQKEIKTAYHKLARKWHPDLHTGKEQEVAEEKIKLINEAYEVLSDAEKRAKYDRLGANWQNGQDFQSRPGTNGAEYYSTSGETGDFSDFFEMFFGAGGSPFGGADAFGRGGRGSRRGPLRGQDLESELELTLLEAYRGGEKSLQFNNKELKSLSVKIPPGVKDGSRIRLRGQGGEGANGGDRGDLFLRIKLLPHPVFTLTDNDLEAEITLRPEQAVLGAQISVPTLDGTVSMKVPSGSHSGKRLRLRGKGWKTNEVQGDLYIKIKIDIPENLTPEELEIYQKLAKLS